MCGLGSQSDCLWKLFFLGSKTSIFCSLDKSCSGEQSFKDENVICIYKIFLASSRLCSRNSSAYVRPDILMTSGAEKHNHLRAKRCSNQTSACCRSRHTVWPPWRCCHLSAKSFNTFSSSAPSVFYTFQYWAWLRFLVEVAWFSCCRKICRAGVSSHYQCYSTDPHEFANFC